MPTYTLQWIGNFDLEAEIEFARVERDYGDGFDRSELVGHSDGQKFYRLKFAALPQSAAPVIVDEQSGANMSRADYIWSFFVRRMQDGQPFYLPDPRTETNVLCKFVENKLSLQLFAAKMWSGGVALRQYRAAS